VGKQQREEGKDPETIEISAVFREPARPAEDVAFQRFPIKQALANVVVCDRRSRGGPLTRDARKSTSHSRQCPGSPGRSQEMMIMKYRNVKKRKYEGLKLSSQFNTFEYFFVAFHNVRQTHRNKMI